LTKGGESPSTKQGGEKRVSLHIYVPIEKFLLVPRGQKASNLGGGLDFFTKERGKVLTAKRKKGGVKRARRRKKAAFYLV